MEIKKVFIIERNGRRYPSPWTGEYNDDILKQIGYEEVDCSGGVPVIRETIDEL